MKFGTRRLVFKRLTYRIVFLLFALVGVAVVQLYVRAPMISHSIIVQIPPPLETEIGDRDISQYEFGGSISNCTAIRYSEGDDEKAEICESQLESARSFLLEHFNDKKRAYVVIDDPNLSSLGFDGITYIFIEPEAGTWEARVRKRVPGPYTWGNRNVNTWYYSEVFRRRVADGDIYLKTGTNALVLRSRGVYELVF